MSGIVATLGRADQALLDRLNLSLLHRGPSDTGAHIESDLNVGIAQRRLALGDPSGGRLPMSTEDGSLWVVLDGEVSNAPALRRRLESAGRTFHTRSDAEVLLHLYAEKGDAMVNEVAGSFAFILIDRVGRRVFGARDRFGVRPLYFLRTAASVVFASEMKALLLVPGFEPRVRRQSVFHFLTLGWVPGGESMLEEIERVPPAHSFTWDIDRNDLSFRRYWQPRLDAREGIADEEAVEIFQEALGSSAGRLEVGGSPMVCALSGGLASSMLASVHGKKAGKRPSTFSLRVGNDARNPAARVASLLSATHADASMDVDDFIRDLVAITWYLDEPRVGGLEAWYAFERMAQQGHSGFTGVGADIVFGCGGRWSALERWPLNAWARRWKAGAAPGIAGLISGGESPVRSGFLRKNFTLTDEEKRRAAFVDPRRLVDTAAVFDDLFRSAPSDDPLDAAIWVEMNTMLPAATLPAMDRFAMANGLDLRHPYLDHEFVQTMLSIPSSIRSTARDPRRLLKLAARHVLPDDIVDDPVSLHPMPVAAWLRNGLRPAAEVLLGADRLRAQGLLNPEYYPTLLAAHLKGADHGQVLWNAFQFQLWHFIFIEQRSRSRPAFTLADLGGVTA